MAEVIARQEASGLSVLAFRRQEELSAHTLYHWAASIPRRTRVKFAMVEVSPETRCSTANAGLELLLAGGERLQIFVGVDAATLRRVLAALRERE